MLQLVFSPFPQLSTERLLLRQMTQDDVADLFLMRSDPAVMRYINRPIATHFDEVAKLIQLITDNITTNDGITWGIVLPDSNKLIGTIGFWRVQKENYRAEIGYMLHPDYHRKGYMLEALAKVIDYGFGEMKLHSIEGIVTPENIASCELLTKIGFVREGYFKENFFYNGEFGDTAIYSLLAVK